MTVFAKIINGEIPSEKLFENERILAIKDIRPIAPVHILIMPKKEYPDLQRVPREDLSVICEMISIAQMLAEQMGIEDGYRLLTNNGLDAGQEIAHLHFHLIGGRKLGKIG